MKAANRKPMPPGSRYGRLTVVGEAPTKNGKSMYRCRCDCGNELVAGGYDLRSGNTRSCGCLQRENTGNANRTHGQSHTGLYHVWTVMKQRCELQSCAAYPRYGGRGIKVCDAWRDSFNAFRDWMIRHGYRPGLTIERLDNDKGYCPENCTLIRKADQSKNRRMCYFVVVDGVKMCLSDAARHYGVVAPSCAHTRVRKLKWTPIAAVTTPPVGGRKAR